MKISVGNWCFDVAPFARGCSRLLRCAVLSWICSCFCFWACVLALPAQANGEAAVQFAADAWYLPADDLLGFVHIPAGGFLMGSDPAIDTMAFENERWSQQRRQGRVELPEYYIGKYEVTVAQYREFAMDTMRQVDPQALAGADGHPVTHVSWTDALAYARWLEARMKASPQTPAPLRELLQAGWHITLPTEAQWEKAARGFGNRIFPWGNQPLPERANFSAGTPANGTTAVGSFDCPECAYGLADMSGNVWELTRSPYQPYPYDDSDDAETVDQDALWVMRGGSFSDTVNLVRAGVRGGVDPGARRDNIGFRLVISGL